MKKAFPDFVTDAEAEAFVDTADLADFDFSDMATHRFDLRHEDASIDLRLPDDLLEQARHAAQRAGVPLEQYIRVAIERALRGRL